MYTIHILEDQINEIEGYFYFRTKVEIKNGEKLHVVRHIVWKHKEESLFEEIRKTINAFVGTFPQSLLVKNQPIVDKWLYKK